MKQNFQKKLESFLAELPKDSVPKLLLHSCCGPCSTYVLSYLSNYFEITVFFYNPNIMPKSEYDRRLSAQKDVLEKLHFRYPVHLIEPRYDPQEFLEISKGLEAEPERGKRCEKCIELRLRQSARYAAENGYDYFCSTLSVSPHKDADLLNTVSNKYALEFNIHAVPADFKKKNGYLESIRLSKEIDLYRQNYCGCIFLKNNQI